MKEDKIKRTLSRYLLTLLVICEGLWTLNLVSLRFFPDVQESFIPRHHFTATSFVEISSLTGVAYSPEEAVKTAIDNMGNSLELSCLALLIGLLGFVFFRQVIIREICELASALLFIFVIFLL